MGYKKNLNVVVEDEMWSTVLGKQAEGIVVRKILKLYSDTYPEMNHVTKKIRERNMEFCQKNYFD